MKIHPLIQQIFNKRNFSPQDIEDFYSENLRELPDFALLPDIQKASERIIQAMQNDELILVFGDYDVDGTTSCALLHHFFQLIQLKKFTLIQPGRFTEGYGLHPPHVEKAHQLGAKVLITVDCGITSGPAAKLAKELGIDLIITDHHQDMNEFMPDAYAIINPNRRDTPEHPFKCLAGVGVAFALAVQIKRQLEIQNILSPSLYPLLAFVAVGTLADLATLDKQNLKLVRHGLKALAQTEYLGLRSFLDAEDKKLPSIDGEKISFHMAPMINSKGRLDHPEKALLLLTSPIEKDVRECYFHLEICNQERKKIQQEVYREAEKIVLQKKEINKGTPPLYVVYQPHWHEGVIGIVASKIVENYRRSAIVFTDAEEKGLIKASARSAGTLDLFHSLNQFQKYFIKFGGHKKAAGLTMPKENLELFELEISRLIQEMPQNIYEEKDFFDLEIDFESIDLPFVLELKRLAPFGPGNTLPLFHIQNLKLVDASLMKDLHVRWHFMSTNLFAKQKIQGVSFYYTQKAENLMPDEILEAQKNKKLSLLASIGINQWAGKQFIQLQVKKLFLTE